MFCSTFSICGGAVAKTETVWSTADLLWVLWQYHINYRFVEYSICSDERLSKTT